LWPPASACRANNSRNAVSSPLAIAMSSSSSIASLLRSGGNKFTDAGDNGNIRSCIRAFDQGQTSMSDHTAAPRRARPADACPSRCRTQSPEPLATDGPCSATRSMSSIMAMSRPADRCTPTSPPSSSPRAPTAAPLQRHDRRRGGRDPRALAGRRGHAGLDQAMPPASRTGGKDPDDQGTPSPRRTGCPQPSVRLIP
jgi:hypothetical protein